MEFKGILRDFSKMIEIRRMHVENLKYIGKDRKGIVFTDVVSFKSNYTMVAVRYKLKDKEWKKVGVFQLYSKYKDKINLLTGTIDFAKGIAKKFNVPFSYFSDSNIDYYHPYNIDNHYLWFELPNKKICSKCVHLNKNKFPETVMSRCNLFSSAVVGDSHKYNYVINHKVPENCPYELEISL